MLDGSLTSKKNHKHLCKQQHSHMQKAYMTPNQPLFSRLRGDYTYTRCLFYMLQRKRGRNISPCSLSLASRAPDPATRHGQETYESIWGNKSLRPLESRRSKERNVLVEKSWDLCIRLRFPKKVWRRNKIIDSLCSANCDCHWDDLKCLLEVERVFPKIYVTSCIGFQELIVLGI